jgi:GNAT superfamily N-acetyltransferase
MVMTPPVNPPGSADHRVEQAGADDIAVLSQVIAGAFHDLDVSRWLVADPDARREIFPAYFRIHVEHAFADGLVLTTPGRDAAALWLPVGPDGPGAPPDGYAGRLAAVTGPHLNRFRALDDAFDAHHPAGVPHQHLAIVAVRPDRQRLGIGTALLHARHAILDRDGIPAYLEASDLDKRDIYRRHGYTDQRPPIRLPDGPVMYPMWRHPRREAPDRGDAR